jgi:hypothetical protein
MERSPYLKSIEEFMYLRRYAKRTIETYIHWIKDFIIFNNKQHPNTLGDAEVEAYLNHLVLRRNVAKQTQTVALK